MVILPYAIDSNDMKMWIDPAYTPAQWAQYAKDSFDWLVKEAQTEGARMMSLGLHLRIIGRPGRIGAFEDVLQHITARDDVWVTTREAVAKHFAEHVPA